MPVKTFFYDTHTSVPVTTNLESTRNPYKEAPADSDESKKTSPIKQHTALRYHRHSLVAKSRIFGEPCNIVCI